jgi:hypothetical protein
MVRPAGIGPVTCDGKDTVMLVALFTLDTYTGPVKGRPATY